MRLQLRPSTSSDPSGSTTVEFYSFRGSYKPPAARPRIRIEPEELTPVSDPIAKLTRECSALRLKLATAERRERNSATSPRSRLGSSTS